MSLVTEYYSGQGRVSYAVRNQLGRPTGGFIFLGDCSKLETKCTVESKSHFEHQTGFGGEDATFETAQKVEITATFDEIRKDNLNFYLYGTTQSVAARTVTDESVTHTKGRGVALKFIPNGAVTVTSSDKATTYAEGEYYSLDRTGMLNFPTTSDLTNASELLVNYQTKEEQITTAFTKLNTDYYFRFDGLNRGSDNKPVIIEIYKARFEPADMLAMINDDFATYDVKGKALYDSSHAGNDIYGGYMRIRTTLA